MIVSKPVILEPYSFKMYVMSTENKEEEKDILELFIKHSRKLKISESFEHDDGREFESAFCYDHNRYGFIGCIYVHLKKIRDDDLDHELIHALDAVSTRFAVSNQSQHDESLACFFVYMKREILKLLKENNIKVVKTGYRTVKKKEVPNKSNPK